MNHAIHDKQTPFLVRAVAATLATVTTLGTLTTVFSGTPPAPRIAAQCAVAAEWITEVVITAHRHRAS